MNTDHLNALYNFPPDYQEKQLQTLGRKLTIREKQQVAKGLTDVIRVMPAEWSQTQKATALYHALAEYLKYDYDASRHVKAGLPVTEDQSFCYLGSVFNGTAVCCGISQLYALLCRACGIYCQVVEGYAGPEDDMGLHSWVQIRLPDENGILRSYHCDPTWDLFETNRSRKFRYFLKSDDYFASHYHEWYYAIGAAEFGWHKFDRCPQDGKVPWVYHLIVKKMVQQLEQLRLSQPYVLKR